MKIVISGAMHDLTSLFENKNVVKRAIVLNSSKKQKKNQKGNCFVIYEVEL